MTAPEPILRPTCVHADGYEHPAITKDGGQTWSTCDRALQDQLARQPAPSPGDVAIATVRGVEGVLVFRLRDGLWVTHDNGDDRGWITMLDDEVTVTSRAVVVTADDRDQLIKDLSGYLGDVGHEDTVNRWFAALLGGASHV